jgi:hypothetical protein
VAYATPLAIGTPSDGTVSTQKIVDGAVTDAKILAMAASKLSGTLAVGSGGTGLTAPGTSGNVLTSDGTSWASSTPATVTFASSAENAAGTIENKAVDPLGIREAFNATGSAPVYACRAWVNFNGTGTVAIRASGNVTSITDNGTGDYTVNFTTAMPDANYSTVLACGMTSSTYSAILGTASLVAATTTSRRFSVNAPVSGTAVDFAEISVAIFR